MQTLLEPMQVTQHLFRLGTGILVQHILAAQRRTSTATGAYDMNLRHAWGTVLGIPLTDAAWAQVSFPVREGGVGFGSIGLLTPVALSCA